MILDWIAEAHVFALAVVVVFLPGLLLGAALRLRRLALWASAPGLSIGVLAMLAVIYPFLGVRWGHLSAGIGVVIAAAIAALIAGFRHRRALGRSSRSGVLLIAGGLAIGGVLNAARLLTYVGRPDAISQTNDAVFHLNALRWIAETGSASSLDLTGMIGAQSFYPAAWHAVTSLVAVDLEQIPTAANMVALVIAALVWPLSIAFMTRVLVGRASVAALAATLSAGHLAFPQLMFEWGVLYPYAMSLAVLPSVFAGVLLVQRRWSESTPDTRPVRESVSAAIVVAVGLVGLTLAQPSSVLVWGLLVMLWGTGWALRADRRPRWPYVVVVAAGWIVLAGFWLALARLAGPVLWRAYRTPLEAVGDVILNSHSQLPAAPILSALLVVGLITALRDRRLLWLVAAWAAVSLLYVVSVATDLPIIKRALTGPWYGDSFRLAAVVPVIVVPIAAIGLAAAIRWMGSRSWRLTRGREVVLTWLAIVVAGSAGLIAVAVAPAILLRVGAETDAESRYALDEESYLSLDEYALLERLPELVPSDAVVIANPSTGAGFAYSLARTEVIPRTWSPPQSEAWNTLAAGLRDVAEDPAVCEALAAFGSPEYVLDFGIGGERPGEYLMPGMTDFDGREGFEEVASEGEASLWRIDACR